MVCSCKAGSSRARSAAAQAAARTAHTCAAALLAAAVRRTPAPRRAAVFDWDTANDKKENYCAETRKSLWSL